jgi:hypothetical protein
MIDTLLPASIAPETSKEFAEKVTVAYINPTLAFAGRLARGEDAKLAFMVSDQERSSQTTGEQRKAGESREGFRSL